MSEHQVRTYTLSGAAYDVITKLYNKGPQEDGDLPSKAGMSELIELGLAKKDPKDAGRNMLTKLGEHEAGVHFTEVAVRKQQEEAAQKEPVDETDPA
ncbi:hypothetical protein D3C76_26190 [compost metagenome]